MQLSNIKAQRMKCLLTLVVFTSYWLVCGLAERILVLAPLCSKSHKISFMPIVEALAEKGHHVTVVTPFSTDNRVENVDEIVLENDIFKDLNIDWFKMQRESTIESFIRTITMFQTTMKTGYELLMSNKEFRKILDSRDVDLVIVDAILNDFVLPVVEHLNVPYIFYCSASGVPWVMDAVNVPHQYASVPGGLGDNGSQMTFLERMGNLISIEMFLLVRKIFWLDILDDRIRRDFPNSRSVSEIERDSQLCIINSHPATAWARPLPQNMVPIPALHTRPAKPLPQVCS